MGGEQHADLFRRDAVGEVPLDGFAHALIERFDEAGVVEEQPHLVDRDGVVSLADSGLGQRPREVLAVLAIAGVRAVRAGRQPEQCAVAVRGSARDRVLDVGRPVAVAPVHRQVDPAAGELRFQRREQLAVVLIDRTHAAEVAIVTGDRLQALIRDAARRA